MPSPNVPARRRPRAAGRLGRQTKVKSAGNGGTTLVVEDYVYDDAGNLTGKTQGQIGTSATVTTTYGYDLADQLTSESSPGYAASYTYDANGNRTSKTLGGTTQTYAIDDGDKLTSITQGSTTIKSYTYDAAGRTKTVASSAGTTTLTYDYESRVTGITYPSAATNSFAYNGLDTRVGKVDSAGTATYRRDGAGVTAPVLSDGSAVYTPGISQRRGGTTTFELPDRLGTSIRQTNASASTQATRTYDAFGTLTASTGTPTGPFGFAGTGGYQEDGDSGLKLLGHRYYDPSTGRFLTRDPIKDGRNWYAYCDGNPLRYVDPEGLLWQELAALAAGGLVIIFLPVDLPFVVAGAIGGMAVGSASALGAKADGKSPGEVNAAGLKGFVGGALPVPGWGRAIGLGSQMLPSDWGDPIAKPVGGRGPTIPYNPVPPTNTGLLPGPGRLPSPKPGGKGGPRRRGR